MFCSKVTRGEIFRAKQYLVGGFRNANACLKIPPEVRAELQEAMTKMKARKMDAFEANASNDLGNYSLEHDNDEVVTVGKRLNIGEREGNVGKKSKHNLKGLIDLYMCSMTRGSNDRGGGSTWRQTSMVDACDKQMRERTHQYIARFFYQAGIAFNVARFFYQAGDRIFELLDSFVEKVGESNVIQVITDNGSNFKMAGEFLLFMKHNGFLMMHFFNEQTIFIM